MARVFLTNQHRSLALKPLLQMSSEIAILSEDGKIDTNAIHTIQPDDIIVPAGNSKIAFIIGYLLGSKNAKVRIASYNRERESYTIEELPWK